MHKQKNNLLLSASGAAVMASYFFFFNPNNKSNINNNSIKKESSKNLTLDIGVSCIPKNLTIPDFDRMSTVKPCDCGEDAFLIRFSPNNPDEVLMAVADGVGSWRKKGINPGLFSRALCSSLGFEYSQTIDDLPGLIKSAFSRLLRTGNVFGSSTLCAVLLSTSKNIKENIIPTAAISNIGDSGLLLIRNNNIIFQTDIQQHRFNAPYQLLIGPDGRVRDETEKAQNSFITLQSGDILLLASDGFYDNVTREQMTATIEKVKYLGAQRMAELLCIQAWKQSHMNDWNSPFELEAKSHGVNHSGGKPDDVTILIAIVN